MKQKNKREAELLFEEGFSCSQAVLTDFAQELGVTQEISLKISSGFGGGMGRQALTCGAVTGAYMVIGLKYGHCVSSDLEGKERVRLQIQQFSEKFKSRHGTLSYQDLLEYDISNTEGFKLANDQQLFKQKCPMFVQDAVEILEKMFSEDERPL